MADKSKRFEDWIQVDCNECARYWDSSCDGVNGSQGSQRPCNSFIATRSVVIPAKIKALEKSVKRLTIGSIVLGLVIVVHLLIHMTHILGG